MEDKPWWFDWTTLIVGVLALLVAIAAAWWARAALFPPKRRVETKLRALTKLLRAQASNMQVTVGAQTLTDPYVVEYGIVATGRHAINSSVFDQGRPLAITMQGSTIVADLTEGLTAGLARTVNGNRLEIGPDLLERHQQYVFKLLVEGEPTAVGLNYHLIDTTVNLNVRTLEMDSRRLRRRNAIFGSAGYAILGFTLIGTTILYRNTTEETLDVLEQCTQLLGAAIKAVS